MKQILATGVIRAPHGIKGFLRVHPYSGDCSHFKNLKDVTVSRDSKEKPLEIEEVKVFGNDILVKFKGIDNPEDARLLSGWDILVPREKASRLGKNEIYIADLIGMKLVYEKEEVGTVVSTYEGPQALFMEVKCLDGKVRIVPYLLGIFIDDVDELTNTIKLLKKELCFEY